MIALAPLLAGFILGGVVYTTLTINNQSEVTSKVVAVKQINLDNIAMSALDLAKEAIKTGGYETTSVFYIEGKDLGYKYLKSKSLDKTIQELKYAEISNNTNEDAVINVGYRMVNNIIYVLIKATKNGKDIFLGVRFTLNGATDVLPLAYAGSGNISGGSMCTMGYDSTNHVLGSVLNPDFNFYLDSNFYANPSFTIPTNATNTKDLQVHAKKGVTITGYKSIDKVYSGGDIVLKDGATVDEAVAVGNISVYNRSSAGTKVSGSNYQYPDINTSFTDNNYNFTAKNADTTKKTSITCGTGACNDLSSYNTNACIAPTNPYNSGTNKTIWNYGYNTATSNNDCLSTYGTKTFSIVNNPYSFNPKKSAWNYGYNNSTGDCSIYKIINYADLTSASNVYLDYGITSGSIVFQWQNPYHEERRTVTGVTPNWGPEDEKRLWIYKFDNPATSCSAYVTSESNFNLLSSYNIKYGIVYKNGKVDKDPNHLNRLGYIWGASNPNGNCQTQYNTYMNKTDKWGQKYGTIEGKDYYPWDDYKFTQACTEGKTNLKWCSNAEAFYNDVFLASETSEPLPKSESQTACEVGQSDYINRSITYTTTANSNVCSDGYNKKNTYNTCLAKNSGTTGTCIDSNNVTLPSGNYDKLIIGNNCNLDLTGSDYTFTNIVVNNNANMTFTNDDVTLKANTIDVKNNSSFTYSGVNPNSYMIMSSNTMTLANNSSVICTDPRQCLVDTNNFTGSNNSTVQGSLLGRDTISLKQSNIYGNMIGETVDTNGAKICNVLDENGNQMMGNSYFDVAAGNNLQTNKIAQILGQALCNSYVDCIDKMNNQN